MSVIFTAPMHSLLGTTHITFSAD